MTDRPAVTDSIEKVVANQDLKYPIKNIKLTLAVLVLGILCLATILVLNVTIQTGLFLMGVNFIYGYQQAQPQQAIRIIYNILSYFSNPIGVGVVIVLYFFISKRKFNMIVHLIYYFFTTYFVAIIVQGFQQSRPIWYDLRIQNWEWTCFKSYANPSGHCQSMVVLYEPILSDTLGYGKYRFMSIPLVLLWTLMPLSRMYLGVHSANQVILGTVLGLIFLVVYKYIYQKELWQLCWQFLTGIRHNIKIAAVVILHILVLAVPIVFFLYNLNNRPMYIRDLDNINKQCGTTDARGEQSQEDMLVGGTSIGSLAFGLLYGFLFIMNRKKYRLFYLGRWYYQRKLKILLMIVVYIVSILPVFLIFYLISAFVVKGSAIGDYFLNCAAILWVGFSLTCLVPILANKWKVITFKDPSVAEEQAKKEQAPVESNVKLNTPAA